MFIDDSFESLALDTKASSDSSQSTVSSGDVKAFSSDNSLHKRFCNVSEKELDDLTLNLCYFVVPFQKSSYAICSGSLMAVYATKRDRCTVKVVISTYVLILNTTLHLFLSTDS